LLTAVCLLILPLAASKSEPLRKKDWRQLVGDWVLDAPAGSFGKMQTRYRIRFEESRFGRAVSVNEDFRPEGERQFHTGGPVHSRILVIGSLERRAGKTVLVIAPTGERPEDVRFEVTYRIAGNALRLQGNIGGAKVSGHWTRLKAATNP